MVWGLFFYFLSLGCLWDLFWVVKYNESDVMWFFRLGFKRFGSVWFFFFWNVVLGLLRKEVGLGYGCLRGCVEENRGIVVNSLYESLVMLFGWGYFGFCSLVNFLVYVIM